MRILIQPYAAKINVVKDGQVVGHTISAKTPKYWREFMGVVHALKPDWEFMQIGAPDDERLPHCKFFTPKIPIESSHLIDATDTWVCPDTWLQHQATETKKGVVIWSRSDPKLFGYESNINLLADEKYLRAAQWATWHDVDYIEEAFLPYEEVISALKKIETELKEGI